jgi:hypothetical protein
MKEFYQGIWALDDNFFTGGLDYFYVLYSTMLYLRPDSTLSRDRITFFGFNEYRSEKNLLWFLNCQYASLMK